jgi:hypothetical protein
MAQLTTWPNLLKHWQTQQREQLQFSAGECNNSLEEGVPQTEAARACGWHMTTQTLERVREGADKMMLHTEGKAWGAHDSSSEHTPRLARPLPVPLYVNPQVPNRQAAPVMILQHCPQQLLLVSQPQLQFAFGQLHPRKRRAPKQCC